MNPISACAIRNKPSNAGATQVVQLIKCPPANAGDTIDSGSIPESGRSSGGGNGSPLQYSCFENSMDRGA